VVRKIIRIDEEKCDGCGLCVSACLEGAIGLVGGKAKLLRDDYCDGLGNCLPACPADAISFETREAAAFDEAAVEKAMKKHKSTAGDADCGCGGDDVDVECECSDGCGDDEDDLDCGCGCGDDEDDASCGCGGDDEDSEPQTLACGCPGMHSKAFTRSSGKAPKAFNATPVDTQLGQWPVQIQLVPVRAPYFKNANLLIAADCSAYSYGNFHSDYMKNKITLIGCPKLDDEDYSEKLTAILKANDIKSVMVTRMEVPCCGGLEYALRTALKNCGKMIPWQVVVISTDGEIIDL
jgi:ferredoxin